MEVSEGQQETRSARGPESKPFFLLLASSKVDWHPSGIITARNFPNFLNISPHNKPSLRLALKHASYPKSVHPLSPTVMSICSSFNLNFLNMSPHNETSLRLALKHASYPKSEICPPPFPHCHVHLQLLQPQFPEYVTPQQSMFETNPEKCFSWREMCAKVARLGEPLEMVLSIPYEGSVVNITLDVRNLNTEERDPWQCRIGGQKNLPCQLQWQQP